MKPKQKTSKFIRLFFIISLIATFQVLIDISSVLADYVGTDVNRIFIDPDSMGVITDGYQVGDEVSFIFETTPAYDGKSLVGMAAWSTVYIPAGVEVISATLVAESGGSYVNIPAKDTAAAQDDCGPRGCNFATSGTLQNGQVNQVQQDTGIFYSTDAQTALLGTPLSISPTGPNVTPQNVYNQWDYNQVLAFGAKTPTALSGNSGKGNTPVVQIGGVWYGTGSPVAGPDTFYQNDYDPTCNSGGGFENNLHCTGPWQRIQHPNAKAGGSGPIVPATTGGTAALLNTAVPTTTGYVLSPANPLPAGVNTVRFVHGIRRVGDMETSRITFRITDAAAFTASFTNNTFCLDATGGDHNKPADPVKGKPARGPQDNNWRYYEGNPHSCFQGSADAALLKQVEYVNGAPASGANLTPGDVIGYAVTFYNTTPAALYDVALSDVPMTANLTLVAPGTAGCAYTSYDGDQAGSTPAYNGGTSGTWAALSSLAAGSSVTVHVCAQVNSGAAFGDAVKNQAFADYATTPGGATTTLNSTTQGYISTQIAGTVYHDKDSSTNYSVGDSGLNGFTAQLWDSAGTTLLATTTTNPDGSYEFNGFPAGDYQVVVLDATGYVSTGDVVGANDDTVPVTLPANGASNGNDFFDATVDYGDLPDTYGTSTANNGAGHTIGTSYLGNATPDAETDGNPGPYANGDDSSGVNDDDGVTRDPATKWQVGNTVNLNVDVTGSNGYLVGWFDWNGDGSFGAGEMVTFGTVSAGTNSLSMSVGAAYGGGSINARFRLYDGNPGTPTPTGIAFNGEVEDYQWNFGPSAVTLQGVAVQNTAVPPVLILVLVGLLAMGTAVLWHSRRQFRTQ